MSGAANPARALPPQRQIVWDFGGVLFRWQPTQLLQSLLPQHAASPAQAQALAALIFESFTPHSDWAAFDLGRVEPAELSQRLARRTGLAPEELGQLIAAIPGHLQALEASVALLQQLRDAGHELYFLSNMPKPYARALSAANPFIAWFADGLFSGDCGLMKPNKDMLALADQRFGLRHADVVFLDDHAGNVEAARAHGWHALQFRDAAQAQAELLALGVGF